MSSTMKIFVSILSVILLINVSSAEFWNRYIDPQTSQVVSISTQFTDSCNLRQAPGFVCMNCETLARCVFRNNGWDAVALESCDAGQNLFCNANEQRCSPNPGPCNPGSGQGGGNFACTSAGVFPDPFSCQMYHMCYPSGPNLIAFNVLCGGNAAFNPATSDCSLTTQNQICQGNQFTCNNVGDMGAWPLNPNIYYICMAQSGPSRILFPTLFRCPASMIFSAGNCVPENGVGGDLFNCPRAGLFADVSDCHYYFHCDGLMRSQRIRCPTGTFFNRLTLGCLRGTC